MASRKQLKKNINHIFNAVADSCIIGNSISKGEQKETYQHLFVEMLNLHQDIVCRISHTEPGNVKGFYKKLHRDFNEGVGDICRQLDALFKEKQAEGEK